MTSNKVVEIHPNQQAESEQVETEAGLWVAKVDRGLSDEEQADLSVWLEANPKHREVFLQFAELWDCMSSLSRLADLFPVYAQVNSSPVKSGIRGFPSAAALFVFACFLGAVTYFNVSSTPSVLGLAEQVYDTRVGEHSSVALIDGSRMVLNTDTRVSVALDQKKRSIHLLRGEFHIDVAHDPGRPLAVIAGNKEFRAVGTAFNVQLNNEQVELIVTDGEVQVAQRLGTKQHSTASIIDVEQNISVFKGEKLVLDAIATGATDTPQKNIADIEADLAWRSGQLIFRGETLSMALKEISRYTNVQFTMDDEALKLKRIAGLFKVGDVKSVLFALEENFLIQHRYVTDDQVVLSLRQNH